MSLKLNSSGGGSVTLQEPTTASDVTLNLPAANTTIVGTDATQTLTNKTIQGGAVTSGTAVASTSGTAIDFTSIPSWAKRITVMFSGVSTNGTSNPQIQIGDSGGVETSGYSGHTTFLGAVVVSAANSAGFLANHGGNAGVVITGVATLCNLTGNVWVFAWTGAYETSAYTIVGSGSKTLSSTLDRIRITTVNGTDTFDAGTINILYEG